MLDLRIEVGNALVFIADDELVPPAAVTAGAKQSDGDGVVHDQMLSCLLHLISTYAAGCQRLSGRGHVHQHLQGGFRVGLIEQLGVWGLDHVP